MKHPFTKKITSYLFENFTGNFIGFVIGMASSRLVSHFFTTRSIRNLWGLAARKTVVDRHTFNALETFVALLIGFVVFEVISKWLKKKIAAWSPVYRRWLSNDDVARDSQASATGNL